MKDFKEWCLDKGYISFEEGTTSDRKRSEKESVKGGKFIKYKDDKSEKVRDIRQDLSGDYKDYARSFGTVWPFKVQAKGNAKPIAHVAK